VGSDTIGKDGDVAPSRPATAGRSLTVFRAAMAALWTLVILALCWMPGTWVHEVGKGSPWFTIPDFDKVVHWGIFSVFSVLWLRVGQSRGRYAWVVLAGVALAAGSEMVQNLPIVGRDGEMADFWTDLFGIVVGTAAARLVEPLFRSLESLLFPRRPVEELGPIGR